MCAIRNHFGPSRAISHRPFFELNIGQATVAVPSLYLYHGSESFEGKTLHAAEGGKLRAHE